MYRNCSLTIIVPVFNEEKTVVQLLEAVEQLDCDRQIVVVDDGSTDATSEILRQYAASHRVLLLKHERNQGKGAAVRTALAHATGELLIVQDADLEYDPRDYTKLTEPILAGEADVVFGSRRMGQRTTWRRLLTPFHHGVLVLNFLLWFWYRRRITDVMTCYKVFQTQTLRQMNLECERFEFCLEVAAKACQMKLRIKEIPISYSPRKIGDGKKIGLKDAFEAAWTLWRYRSWNPNSTSGRRAGVSSSTSLEAVGDVVLKPSIPTKPAAARSN